MSSFVTFSVHIPKIYPYTVPVKVVSFYPKRLAVQYTEYLGIALPPPVCRQHTVKAPGLYESSLAFYRKHLGQPGT